MTKLIPSDLKKFTQLKQLDEDILQSLCHTLTVKTAQHGEHLFAIGESNNSDLFLLSGRVKLVDKENYSSYIEPGLPNANRAIAPANPRKHQATSIGTSTYFTIDRSVLEHALQHKKRQEERILTASLQANLNDSDKIFRQFEHELSRGHFVLPSFPETALAIRKKIDEQDCDIADIINLILTDPGISAKLIKTANSPLYRGVNEYQDITSAVMRLGLNTSKQLVISFAILNLFDSDSKFFQHTLAVLRHKSIDTACLAFILAEEVAGVNQEEALLAGLLSAIGQLIVICYAEQYDVFETRPGLLALTIEQLWQPAAQMAAEQWQFPQTLKQALLQTKTSTIPSQQLTHNKTLGIAELIYCCRILSLCDIFNTQHLPSDTSFQHLQALYQQLPAQPLALIQGKQQRFDEIKALLTL